MAANYSVSNEQNHRWSQYGWILAAILFATLIRFPVQPLMRDAAPFLFYFPVVVGTAIVFGRKFGLLATVLSILPANYFWMPPDNAFEMNLSDAWHIFDFSFVGFSISWLSETARKRKQLEEHLRATLASVGDAIVTTDCCGNIVYFNTIARRLTEVHGDEAIGRTVGSTLDLLAENGEFSLNGTFQAALTSDDIESLPRRVIISSKSGKRYRVEQVTSRILDANGRMLGFAILFHHLGCDNDELPATAVIKKEGPPNAMPLKSRTLPQSDKAAIGSSQSPVEAEGIEAHEFNKRGLFIGGCPKSGTTLLMSLLDSHPQLVVLPEETSYLEKRPEYLALKTYQTKLRLLLEKSNLALLAKGCQEPARYWGSPDTRTYDNFDYDRFVALTQSFINQPWMNDSLLFSEVIRAYGIVLGADWRNCVRWVEKTPRTESHLNVLNELFPDAKLIQIVRDPRAVFASVKNRIMNQYGCHTKAHRLVRSWNRSAREILRLGQDPSRFLVVRYEDLVRNPREVLEEICRFGGFDFSENMLEPSRAGNGWQGNSAFHKAFHGISIASVDQWKGTLTEQEIWWIEMHCHEGMALANYPFQTNARFTWSRWLKRLPGESWFGYLRGRRGSFCQHAGLLKECRYDTKKGT